ncbi:hypothetical protein D3C87_1278740 [compost metagenome]
MGDDFIQILLEHHAIGEQRSGIGPGQNRIKLVEAFDHFLTASGAGMNRLEADRAGVEQMFGRRPCILEREHAEAIEHDTAHPFGEQRRPASRRLGIVVEQTVADGFGADEIMLDVTAPQIVRPFDSQLSRGVGTHQRLGRQQIELPTTMLLRVVAAAKFQSEDVRQPTGQRAIGFHFMQRCVGVHRMGDHQFLAVCWGHASPFNQR